MNSSASVPKNGRLKQYFMVSTGRAAARREVTRKSDIRWLNYSARTVAQFAW
jgi:hypothetical protein